MTVGTCGCPWMSLDAYLIERAPRCVCYASPRPRPADGADGAMRTVGGHMQLEVKHADTFRHQAGCWLLPHEGCNRLSQYYLWAILNGTADVLPTWCYTYHGRGG